MGIKKVLLGTSSALLIGAVCAFGAYPTAEVSAAEAVAVKINEENFPDANFREYVSSTFDTGAIKGTLTVDEINKVTSMTFLSKSFNNLTGIEYFVKLETLKSTLGTIKNIDVSKNTALTRLECVASQISQLDVSGCTALTYLDCGGNKLTSLDLSNNTALTELICNKNNLKTLDLSKNTALTRLTCGGNKFETVDLSSNKALTYLDCSDTGLSDNIVPFTSIDVSKNTALTYLSCAYNSITSLDVSNNTALTVLDIRHNQLSAIDVSKNTALKTLDCSSNPFTAALDVSKNPALTNLYCSGNSFTALDLSKNPALIYLDCKNNDLTALDLSKNPGLTKLYCSDNQLASLEFSTISVLETLDCNNNKLEKLSVKDFTYLNSLSCKGNNLKVLDVRNDPLSVKFDYDSDVIAIRNEYGVYDEETGVALVGYNGASIGSDLVFSVQKGNTSGIRIPGERIIASYDLILRQYGLNVIPANISRLTIFAPDGADWENAKIYAVGNGGPSDMSAAYNPKNNSLSFLTKDTGLYIVTVEGENTVTKITDEQTKITIEGINGTLFDWDAVLDVQKKDTSGISITGEDVAAAYDIKLKRGGEEIKPEGTVRVTIPVPGEITDGASAKIFHQEANGTYTKINTVYNSGNKTLSFETDSLGVYAVTTETPYPDGDINHDKVFDIDDVIDLARSILTTTDPAKNPYLPDGDRDKSGKIDIDDVILLARELIM